MFPSSLNTTENLSQGDVIEQLIVFSCKTSSSSDVRRRIKPSKQQLSAASLL